LPAELFDPNPGTPLHVRLFEIAQAFYAMVSSPEAVAGHRILCTPQMADSPVPGMFWEAGPKRVQGEFARGDVIAVRSAAGVEVARGLANYASAEARLIARKPSSEFERLLGFTGEPEMIHRDNMVLS
jgi:hypothetical protein